MSGILDENKSEPQIYLRQEIENIAHDRFGTGRTTGVDEGSEYVDGVEIEMFRALGYRERQLGKAVVFDLLSDDERNMTRSERLSNKAALFLSKKLFGDRHEVAFTPVDITELTPEEIQDIDISEMTMKYDPEQQALVVL